MGCSPDLQAEDEHTKLSDARKDIEQLLSEVKTENQTRITSLEEEIAKLQENSLVEENKSKLDDML